MTVNEKENKTMGSKAKELLSYIETEIKAEIVKIDNEIRTIKEIHKDFPNECEIRLAPYLKVRKYLEWVLGETKED